ncbi:hypothetical protein C8R45DRAFT_1106950 [Mycena sanguinolenta]|nr:hypothetical protein C8R45DRAFT_1106950 [Mycena sanguinolenta]
MLTALWYYARWALVAGLLLAIRSAHAAREDARVMVWVQDGRKPGVDDYAARNPGITFVHAHPGLVITPLLKHFSYTPEILATGKSIEVCGEHQLYALLKAPAGASRTGHDGDDMGMDLPATEEVQQTLWQHTEEVIGGIE